MSLGQRPQRHARWRVLDARGHRSTRGADGSVNGVPSFHPGARVVLRHQVPVRDTHAPRSGLPRASSATLLLLSDAAASTGAAECTSTCAAASTASAAAGTSCRIRRRSRFHLRDVTATPGHKPCTSHVLPTVAALLLLLHACRMSSALTSPLPCVKASRRRDASALRAPPLHELHGQGELGRRLRVASSQRGLGVGH